jgi:hypothetical protein
LRCRQGCLRCLDADKMPKLREGADERSEFFDPVFERPSARGLPNQSAGYDRTK